MRRGYGLGNLTDKVLASTLPFRYEQVVQYRIIPGTDCRVSQLSLGGWLTFGGSVPDAEALRILHAAVAAGVNHLDLADVYARGGAEQVVGRFLCELPGRELVIASKVFWPMSDDPRDRGLSRRHIHESIDRSLQRLGRDQLELYYCHREDPSVPLAETVQAMGDLVRAGKVRAWGTSCWRPATLREAHRLAAQLGVDPPRVEQPRYNLFERGIERDVVPACRELGMAIVVWSPLAGGVLTGKYLDGRPAGSRGATSKWVDEYLTPERLAAMRSFAGLCAARAVNPGAVALAWAMQQPGITAAIVGASTAAQLQDSLAAVAVALDPEFVAQIERLFPGPRRSWLGRLLGRG